MSRSPAKFTESDVRRVLTAARKAQCAVRISIEKDVTGGRPGEPTHESKNSARVSTGSALVENRTLLGG
jgi:hypothetical protein